MVSKRPAAKVYGASLGAAIGTVVVWALRDLVGVPVPEYVAMAMATIASFIVGYVVPPSPHDGIDPGA